MLSELGRRPMVGANEGSFGDDLENEIGLLLREQRRQEADDLERELNLYRSGSAPPTVEGSLSAVGGVFGGNTCFSEFGGANVNEFSSDEDFRSDPAYLSYYYANVNLNPRLPPPLLSREEQRYAQRLKGGSSVLGGIGDRRAVNRADDNGGNRSLFTMPPGFDSRNKESEAEAEKLRSSGDWGVDGLIGLPGIGLGNKKKSLAEIFQDDLGRKSPVNRLPSRPASRNAFSEGIECTVPSESDMAHLRHELTSGESLRTGMISHGTPSSYTYAAALGSSLSRSTTPDPQLVARAPSPCPTPIGAERISTSEKRAVSSHGPFGSGSSRVNESSDLVSALKGMNLSESGHMNIQSGKVPYSDSTRSNGVGSQMANSSLRVESQKSSFSSGNSYMKGSPTSTLPYQLLDNQNSVFSNYGSAGYSLNPPLASMAASQLGNSNLPPLFENVAAASAMGLHGMDSRVLGGGLASNQSVESHNLGKFGTQMLGSGLQGSYLDPMYLQYLRTSEYAAQLAALNDPSVDRSLLGNSYLNLLELQKAYLGTILSPQKSQFGVHKSGASNHHGFYGSPPFGGPMSYPGSPLASTVIPGSPVGPGSPMRFNELNMRYPSGMRNFSGGVVGPWPFDAGLDDGFGSSLLEEFKSNKAKCFELSEIAGHVVEFSADQYGSRFIQQKLETATTEEKTMVYQEIMPHALALMTDVFGNYVIQKFFDHGLSSQRRELAGKLFNHVLTLSLQMYGCRVIQKAIEVVDLDQKIKMVQELDGHVMRCVRDQNGNHVIQKCIECVPEENIQFIVTTFFDQIVTLSTHPYGCRVVQRILEHCKDQNTQRKVMGEILSSVSMLAQDQYGNYVVQHVLEHGLPDERSIIIKELAGKIVLMSQQKFASNVVEKCLIFGDPSERQLLVHEMLGSTDENEPLQAMMKDQFANYVVQKVLETCDDQQRELILSRIKVHLNALKKYTYGKHIVARVEKLVAAGERRIAAQTPSPATVA